MANTSISNLTAGAAVSATDVVPNVQTAGVGPVKTTAAELKTYMSNSPTLVTPDIGAATGTSLNLTGTLAMGSSFVRNRLINGSFSFAQRGTSITSATLFPNNNDAYALDRWYLLSDGNNIVNVTQSTTVPANGAKYAQALTVQTTNKKFGFAQIIENINCQDLIGNTVSLSFKAKVSATTNLSNIKAAVVSWSGTADTVTSDIISAWNVAGTSPTLIANATYENTPANLNVTTSYATYKIENIAIDTANTSNIIVFIWSDVTTTTATTDVLYVTDVQLEYGATATAFERRLVSTEQAFCFRYFQSLSKQGYIFLATADATSTSRCPISFVQLMRVAPTTITIPAVGSGAGQMTFMTAGGLFPGTIGTLGTQAASVSGFEIYGVGYTGAWPAAGTCITLYVNGLTVPAYTVNAEL